MYNCSLKFVTVNAEKQVTLKYDEFCILTFNEEIIKYNSLILLVAYISL